MRACYIIDDEEHAISTLADHIERTPGLTLAGRQTDPLRALEELRTLETPDILFLDVDMPGISGLELASLINPAIRIVITTAFASYAAEAFDKDAVDFLLKPVSYPRFLKAIAKLESRQPAPSAETASGNSFFINPATRGKMIQIYYDDIFYVEGLKNYVIIYTQDEKHISYLGLQEMQDALPPSRFIRVHKSFVVNLARVKSVEGQKVNLSNGMILPLGGSYKDALMEHIALHTIRTRRK
jgi:two-component system, LytTR family, response regulator